MKLKAPERQRLKLAAYILRQVQSRDATTSDRISYPVQEIKDLVLRLDKASVRLDHCDTKGWRVAAKSQMEVVSHMARELCSRASGLLEAACVPTPAEPPTLRDVVGDLDQLKEEFDQVVFDAKNHTVTVRIEPITLNDVYLGDFEIRLNLADLPKVRRRRIYTVVALDPHPAGSNDNVTHPHVRDEELCEGDASIGIRHALEAGRLCDFFMLVRSVLQHYNSGSPYVSLDSWEGIACHDCGDASDESRYCDGCNCDYCDDCMSYCRQCDDSRCRGCLETCDACEESVCRNCRKTCKGCGKVTCDGCLEDRLCPACREEEEESDGELESITTAAVTDGTTSPAIPLRQRRRNRHRRIAA